MSGEKYSIVNGWVCRETGDCTCSYDRYDPHIPHEPGCGLENLFPIAQAEQALVELTIGAHRGTNRVPRGEFNPNWTLGPKRLLAEIMTERGWTMSHVADNTNVSQGEAERYIEGRATYPAEWAVAFAKMLDVSPHFVWNLQNNYLLDLALGKKDVTNDFE